MGRVGQDVLSGAAAFQSAPDTGRILGKFNFGVGMRELEEGREGEGLEAVRYIFKQSKGSSTS